MTPAAPFAPYQGHRYAVHRTGGVGLVIRRKRDGADCLIQGNDAAELEKSLTRVEGYPPAIDRLLSEYSALMAPPPRARKRPRELY
jgi:hypothetical protein